ncbi:ribonuclease [Rhodoferax aquaticus]|uniref:Uncharacterized protein n=1 Tax=Rhodoferax aquaticus TaxID=2527691 RepID=A0A515EUD2_9BURK|nr:ribonuclease [Rhodoferax aquaticus]QDL56276.1 hypothetical protein EXZ61_20125 [Rhodoferax aquaticus]
MTLAAWWFFALPRVSLKEIALRKLVFKSVLTYLLCIAAACFGLAHAKDNNAFWKDEAIALSAMPLQGQQTYQLILSGGPFPYEKDGTVFGNRERLLPSQKRGFYLEYTVKTPGASNRGARRIVCGGPRTKPEACFYTADHYASFRKIVP